MAALRYLTTFFAVGNLDVMISALHVLADSLVQKLHMLGVKLFATEGADVFFIEHLLSLRFSARSGFISDDKSYVGVWRAS